jgi:glycosyltransferase involved in cell wall biosynthesis
MAEILALEVPGKALAGVGENRRMNADLASGALVEVSVIVPLFNAEPYIGKCLDSILAQEGVSLEVLCVDDCGTDRTADIAAEYAGRDGRVCLIRQPKNSGPGQARNVGVERARGEYFACVDDDDWILPGALAKSYSAATATGADSVCFKHVCYLGNGDAFALEASLKKYNARAAGWLENALGAVPFSSWGKIYRTETVRRNGISWPGAKCGEDGGFHFKFFSLFPATYLLAERFYVYRRREGSLMDGMRLGLGGAHDLKKVAVEAYGFLRARGIYEKRKREWQAFIGSLFEPYLYLKAYKAEAVADLRNLLLETGFPGEYEGCRHFALFQAVRAYRRPWWRFAYWPFSLLLALIPFPERRRKLRCRLRVACLERSGMKHERYARHSLIRGGL